MPTNPKSQAYHLTVSESGWTEYTVNRACRYVTVRQLVTETQAPFLVKHRSDDVGEDADCFAAGETWYKGDRDLGRGINVYEPGDTIGFFQRASGSGNLTLVFVEHED